MTFPLARGARCRSAASRALVLVALVLGITAPSPSQAVPIAWRSKNFEYVADGKPLKDVLRDFGGSQGMAVAISSDIDGTVAGKFKLAPAEFLDLLALSYGFVWYYNGAVLHIASAKGIRSTLVKMSSARVEQLREALTRMQVQEPRFPIVYDETENTALVSGPQEYVDVVRELAAHLESRGERNGRSQTRIFALRNAWAADRTIDGQPQPGVASLMRSMFQDNRAGASPDAARLQMSRMITGEAASSARVAPPVGPLPSDTGSTALPGLPSLRGSSTLGGTSAFANTGEGTAVAPSAGATASAGGPAAGGKSPQEEGLPVIMADANSNSVIVRDLPERMPDHERFIRTLDARPSTVEIEVHILDVDDGALRDLGIDWTVRGNRLEVRTGDGKATMPGVVGGALQAATGATPEGAVLTAVLGNSGRYLLARVAALETAGRATVSARPKVATLNNVAAFMDNQESFHVKVGGYQSTQLYNVSTGMSLRVTPMVSPAPEAGSREGRQIKLDVHLQDGQVNYDRTVDGLPVVLKSEIATQALMLQGESLLLAGYSTERQKTGMTGVPLLSDLPVVGQLFRHNTTDTKRRERMFLISPRVLESDRP